MGLLNVLFYLNVLFKDIEHSQAYIMWPGFVVLLKCLFFIEWEFQFCIVKSVNIFLCRFSLKETFSTLKLATF